MTYLGQSLGIRPPEPNETPRARMSKTYALKRLLEHGPLRMAEILECTGWECRQAERALHALVKSRRVRCIKEFHRWNRYEAVR